MAHNRRSGFSLIELLLVCTILAVMVAMFLVAVQKTRDAADRSMCEEHLREIGTALHAYHDISGGFPNEDPGVQAELLYVALLPFLEQEKQNLASPTSIATLLCPARRKNAPGKTDFAAAQHNSLCDRDFRSILGGKTSGMVPEGTAIAGYWIDGVILSYGYAYVYITYGLPAAAVPYTTDFWNEPTRNYWYRDAGTNEIFDEGKIWKVTYAGGDGAPWMANCETFPVPPAYPYGYGPGLGAPNAATLGFNTVVHGNEQGVEIDEVLPDLVKPNTVVQPEAVSLNRVTSRDGASHSLLLSHKEMNCSAYAGGDVNDTGWAVVNKMNDRMRFADNQPPAKDSKLTKVPAWHFGAPHTAVPSLFADNSVRAISYKISGSAWTALWTYNGKDNAGEDQLAVSPP